MHLGLYVQGGPKGENTNMIVNVRFGTLLIYAVDDQWRVV